MNDTENGDGVSVGVGFASALDVPVEWAKPLLAELSDTHHVGSTCDPRGGFRMMVNRRRREFLVDVLGLDGVDYQVCEYCRTFVLSESPVADDWPYPGVCDACEHELPSRDYGDDTNQ